MAFYDCIMTYAFSEKDANSKYYISSIYQTARSIRLQRRHVKAVKDCIKRTMLTKELAAILDVYLREIEDRIKYLNDKIVPIHIGITPLAALYYSCKDNDEDFYEKMIDFILPEEINVYSKKDYKEDADYNKINETRKANSERLCQLINDFNTTLERENKELYDKYMADYYDFINNRIDNFTYYKN